jgi:hypothetical protein
VRVCAWVKPFSPMKPRVSVQHGWEPIILRGGRRRSIADGLLNDWVAANPVRPTRAGDVVGMKPDEVLFWLFRALGARPGDELVDLFPGSGRVIQAWERFLAQPAFSFPRPTRVQLQLDELDVAMGAGLRP